MNRRSELYAKARGAFARGEEACWELAEIFAELTELGETQRQIADEMGCHYTTVGRYLAVWRGALGTKNKPRFTEALAEVRGDRSAEKWIPRAPEQRAELVAGLLKDKAIADAPAVRKVQERHADRRLRAEAAAYNREKGIPTRTQSDRERRKLSVVENSSFWSRTLAAIQDATKALNDATGEVERTGLPRSGSGETIRAARALARAVEKFEQAATSAGIGKAM